MKKKILLWRAFLMSFVWIETTVVRRAIHRRQQVDCSVCTELFLALNGYSLTADNLSGVTMMLTLAAGEIDKAAFASWLRANVAAR
ncbi:MAG: hypothetical protein V4500_00185 [Pseudomonadota bacterium]